MKAAILIPTLTAGGAEKVASILANEWSDYPDTHVTVFLMFEHAQFFALDPRVTVHNLGLETSLSPWKRAWAVLRGGWQFRSHVLKYRPDFVLSFMNKYNIFCLLSLMFTRVAVIVSERDSPDEPDMRINWLFRKGLYPFSRGIIAQTQRGAQFLREEIRHPRIEVIPNPIEVAPARIGMPREKVVLSVGRLVHKKGHLDLVHAFASLEHDDWQLVICGDGPLREDIERSARELGVADRVRLMGEVASVQQWYDWAGVFAFPSLYEGFPNALAEALMSGAPTVSYDCSTGPAELIDNEKSGLLVPTGDVAALAAGINRLIVDRPAALAMAATATALNHTLSPKRICDQYFGFCVAVSAGRHL